MNIKFEFEKAGHTIYLWFNEEKDFFVSFTWSDWVNILEPIFRKEDKWKWNWRSFTFIIVYFEDDILTQGLEFELGLLGFLLRFRINKENESPQAADLDERIKNVTNNVIYSEKDIENAFLTWTKGRNLSINTSDWENFKKLMISKNDRK